MHYLHRQSKAQVHNPNTKTLTKGLSTLTEENCTIKQIHLKTILQTLSKMHTLHSSKQACKSSERKTDNISCKLLEERRRRLMKSDRGTHAGSSPTAAPLRQHKNNQSTPVAISTCKTLECHTLPPFFISKFKSSTEIIQKKIKLFNVRRKLAGTQPKCLMLRKLKPFLSRFKRRPCGTNDPGTIFAFCFEKVHDLFV